MKGGLPMNWLTVG